jgi:phospholipid transport system transporter-binding protein
VAAAESTGATGVPYRAPARLRADEAQGFLAAAAGASVVDLGALADFDSSAVAALVALGRRAAASGTRLRCVNAAPNLRKLAALYGVDGLLFDD